eukprot:CAMPEP_0172882282 /NCGR_PEP_ID=MMETSP1075-20121228/119763_1 /TAXON_ID=2916 /ORGANISM="Ceratium fusus, Strain PA161109" /LENGTH=46 /DNA_ID= /DNA_START= /DNA_END= /DNA_ORIENTATION=
MLQMPTDKVLGNPGLHDLHSMVLSLPTVENVVAKPPKIAAADAAAA